MQPHLALLRRNLHCLLGRLFLFQQRCFRSRAAHKGSFHANVVGLACRNVSRVQAREIILATQRTLAANININGRRSTGLDGDTIGAEPCNHLIHEIFRTGHRINTGEKLFQGRERALHCLRLAAAPSGISEQRLRFLSQLNATVATHSACAHVQYDASWQLERGKRAFVHSMGQPSGTTAMARHTSRLCQGQTSPLYTRPPGHHLHDSRALAHPRWTFRDKHQYVNRFA